MVACCLEVRLSEFCVHGHDVKACGKMVHRWATHNCPLTIHTTYYQFSTFCMKLAKLHLLKSGRAGGQMATPHGRLLTIYCVCCFLLLYMKTKLIVDSQKYSQIWQGRWSNVAQVGNTWSAADHLWTRDTAIPFSEQAILWLDEILFNQWKYGKQCGNT